MTCTRTKPSRAGHGAFSAATPGVALAKRPTGDGQSSTRIPMLRALLFRPRIRTYCPLPDAAREEASHEAHQDREEVLPHLAYYINISPILSVEERCEEDSARTWGIQVLMCTTLRERRAVGGATGGSVQSTCADVASPRRISRTLSRDQTCGGCLGVNPHQRGT